MRWINQIFLTTAWAMGSAWAIGSVSIACAAEAEGIQFFETKIRPVLVKHCYECHSSDSDSLRGGLLVDSAKGLQQGGDSGPAIIERRPDDSLLIQALRYENYEMPPSGKLPENVIADFVRWIEMGAPDPRTEANVANQPKSGINIEEGRRFWAFQPIELHVVPDIQNTTWSRTWIDRFILAKLEEAGLQPQIDADRATLLRRLAYDLTGLPPSESDLEKYLENNDPRVIEEYVDQLLESPQFGVQWGRHWLDVARYADSNGADFNATFHNAWRYRNYVIDSFNQDRPFSDLIIEQIAGDLLPAEDNASRERQLVATGFLMLGTKMLSERNKEKLRMDVVDDQISTIGSAFLGMTLGCARCHDHKFDPIPTRDYYALAGIFKSTQVLDGEFQQYVSNWVRQPLPIDPAHAAALESHKQQVLQVKQQLKNAEATLKKLTTEKSRNSVLSRGVVLDDVNAKKVGNWKPSTFYKPFVGEGYLHDDRSDKGQKKVIFQTRLPADGEYEVRIAYVGTSGRATNVPITVEHAAGSTTVHLNQTRTPSVEGLLEPVGRWQFKADADAVVTISNADTEGYVIVDAVQLISVSELQTSPEPVDEEWLAKVKESETRVEKLKKELKELEAAAPPAAPMALAVNEVPHPGDCNLCIRGDVGMLGPKIPRGFLEVASFDEPPQIPEDQSGRLELAHWIADPRNPLTARVYVNRVWHHLLGEGLVRSVDNFGHLGERPTHPDLLDQLAVEFISHDWSTKWLVREIVLSRVYQQSSVYNEDSWKIDPENRLLWRAHRKRISAESIRDTMLAASGQLDLASAESPVAGLGTLVSQNNPRAQKFEAEASTLRTVYQPVVRGELPPLLRVFDFADPDLSAGARPTTNVPAQALWMLNGDFIAEQAQLVVDRAFQKDLSTVSERIQQLTRMTLGRPPTPEEARIGQQFVDTALQQAPPDNAAAEQTAYREFVHALFASSSFRMLD